ncbi:hypothetical protein P7C73_g6884, partial [Tremellales sp. Uapishka_1]
MPSVLTPVAASAHQVPSPMQMDAFGISAFPAGSSEPPSSPHSSRRQRISMACQYCRHRKIRCCGSAPCRNCSRAHRTCDYTPVPEEVNKATREKKALAKSSRASNYSSPMSNYSPFFLDTPVFDVPMQFGQHVPRHPGHRRSVSTPNFEHFTPPPAPQLRSPPMFESSQWMYNWSSAPVPDYQAAAPSPHVAQTQQPHAHPHPCAHPARQFPSVLAQTPLHQTYLAQQQQQPLAHLQPPMEYTLNSSPATPPDSRSPSVESAQWHPLPNQPPHTPLSSGKSHSMPMSLQPQTPGTGYYSPF